MPLFKRIFGQGKSKASNSLAAICIGDYSRITLQTEGNEAHQLHALLVHEVTVDEGSSSTSQLTPTGAKSGALASQPSFKGFRHLLQHFGGGTTAASAQDGLEADAQQQLSQFFKNLGAYSSVSFITAGEDGLIYRDKVLTKLTKLFKHTTAPVVLVSYCGPSDERGNWRLASQIPGSSGGSAGSAGGGGGGGGGGAAAGAVASGTCVLSFREVSMLWQRYRKHSQRLVLLLDCANSGYWVSGLKGLSKAEQLELSLGVQASDCSIPAMQAMQLTYRPGIFTQFFLVNNKWRHDSRRKINVNTTQPQPQYPQPQNPRHQQQQQQQHQCAVSTSNSSSQHNNTNSSVAGGMRGEKWLPGMLPSYYATWLNDNLVDYSIALKFFNIQIHPVPAGGPNSASEAQASSSSTRQTTESALDHLFPTSPLAASMHQRAWRASTGPLAGMESFKSLGAASRLADEVTSPSSEAWASPRFLGAHGGGGGMSGTGHGGGRGNGSESEVPEHGSLHERTDLRGAIALRAVSMQESVRRRFSLLYDHGMADGSPGMLQTTGMALSPHTPTMQRVRLSTPQGEWRGSMIPSVSPRFPTLPGEESMCRMGQDTDGSGTTLVQMGLHSASNAISPSPSGHGDSGGDVVAVAVAGASGSRLQGRSSAPSDSSPGGTNSLPIPLAKSRLAATLAAAGSCAGTHSTDVDMATGSVTDTRAGTCSVLSGAVAGSYERSFAVHQSAPSDSVAMAWDRRSSHADRFLVRGDVAGAGMSSFTIQTNPSGRFAKELYGALHTVATDRRLLARRTPLGGDETLDSMMEDADLERRASVASLPSAMLPRNLPRTGSGPGDSMGSTGGGGGGGGGQVPLVGGGGSAGAPPSSTGSTPYGRSVGVTATNATIAAIATASAAPISTPRTSVLLGAAAEDAGQERGLSSVAQRKHASRLFLMSLASHGSTEGELLGQMAAVAGEYGSGGGGSDNMEGLSMTVSFDGAEDVGVAEAAQDVKFAAAFDEQQYDKQSLITTDDALKAVAQVAMNLLVSSADLTGAPPVFPDWPQPADSPLPLPSASLTQSSHDLRRSLLSGTAAAVASASGASQLPSGGGGGGTGGILRSLVRQHVSIADSMDLDSTSTGAHLQMWQRRPGRFEMAGSESSSFVFGDDQDRFDMLRMLRAHETYLKQEEEARQMHHDRRGAQHGVHNGDEAVEVARAL